MAEKDAPVMALPRRLDYFPPITTPATMFQRRKKKSARELYQLSPENQELIGNPPTTPWAWDDSTADFFGTFIGTGFDQGPQHAAPAVNGSSLKTTWPFLRQLGPRCVFRGMRKKTNKSDENLATGGGENGGGGVNKPSNSQKYECNNRGTFNERFLEPECIGISRELAFRRHQLQYISPHLQQESIIRRQVSSSHFKNPSPLNVNRLETSPRGINAPPPSERRSGRSDDTLIPDDADRLQRASSDGVTNARPGSRIFYHKYTSESPRRNPFRYASEERTVRFEEAPLPEKLRHLSQDFDSERLEHADMSKLTWQDIVQAAPVIRLGAFVCVDGGDARTLRNAAAAGGESNPNAKTESHISFRLPKPKPKSSAPVSDAAFSSGPTLSRDKRLRRKGNVREITTWVDDVRKSHVYNGRSTSR